MMSRFLILGSTIHDWGWPKNGPFWTKNGRLVNAPKWSIWTLMDHFKQELIFCSVAPLQNPILSIWGKIIIFV